jgi:crotonobetainyl-CoA:carnitine CoA-transferase CaiB-like acyl-CoA transferase
MQSKPEGFLDGVRVLELADELGEFAGRVLAGVGADVIKIEPPGGEKTRGYGPFYKDEPHPERSLYFWHYNQNKRGIVLDLDAAADQERFRRLVKSADVLIDSRPRAYLPERQLDYDALRKLNPGLVYVRISAFGDDGPWADWQASDLVHLALGGVMMNCGYDARPDGSYDTPPIAPQMWQSYHIAGEVTAIQVMAALMYRNDTGQGQKLSCSVHEAVSMNTEVDLPSWVYLRQPHKRQTCQHSFPDLTVHVEGEKPKTVPRVTSKIAQTKDGRWIFPYRTYLPQLAGTPADVVRLVQKHGMTFDLEDPKYVNPLELAKPEVALHVNAVLARLVASYKFDRDIWKDAQAEGLAWGPIRRPEENAADPHWTHRETFADVEYPDLGKSFKHVNAKWMSPSVPWPKARRAALLGQHTAEVLDSLSAPSSPPALKRRSDHRLSRAGKPFALSGVRIVDLSWMLASAGAGRFFTAHGADVIKVEHRRRLDGMRGGMGFVPPGKRAERDRATGPISFKFDGSIDGSGAFMEINAGKRAISLNLGTARGKEILTELLKDAHVVMEGFTPGTMERMGFGYETLKRINPRIVYVQQSGLGQFGTYGKLRTFGPTAAAFSGISDMSGLPEPYAPAGIGYSYLDWFGAYQMATATIAGLYRQQTTGQGCWIDSSQVETGIGLTGTAVLDYFANGRHWMRTGNRSPWKPAAPHGAYRTRGEDRWIAIAAFSDAHWKSLIDVLGTRAWAADAKLATLADRLANQDTLDALVEKATVEHEPFELMQRLQKAGVPAGVCQTAQDRCERDPQLKHLNWQVELEQSTIGRWPVKDVPVKFSETPPCVGGFLHRHGPNYGEDNADVYGKLLKLSDAEIEALAREGIC